MQESAASRNGEFDFWKLVGAFCILLQHSHALFGGEHIATKFSFLAVEYFFMATGWFFATSIHRDQRPFSLDTIGSETWAFLLRKIRAFAPYYVVGFVLALLAKCLTSHFAVLSPKNVPGVFFDLILLKEAGIPHVPVEGISWYLSAMLIAMFLMYPLFRLRKNFFQTYLAPFLALWILGMLFLGRGTVAYPIASKFGIATPGTLRAVADISLGVCAHGISRLVQRSDLWRDKPILLSILGMGSGIAAFGMMLFMGNKQNVPFVIFLLFILVSVCGSRTASVNRVFKPIPCAYLGKLSMALFFTHTAVWRALLYAGRHNHRLHALFAGRDACSIALSLTIYLFLALCLAVFCIWLCERPFLSKTVKQP